MDRNKTVLFLPAWYPNRNDKLGGVFSKAFGLALNEKINVHILHVAADKNIRKFFDYEKKVDDGLETHIVYYKKPERKTKINVLLEGILYGFSVAIGYYQYRKQNKTPHLFHVFVLTRAAVFPYLFSFFYKTPYYVTEVWSRYMPQDNTYQGSFRKWLTRRIAARSNGISTVSLSLKEALIKHGITSPNFQIINSVVPQAFYETKLSDKTESKKVRFLHVSGFLNHIKNISGMLNAFKMVQSDGYDFELQLVGDGPDHEEMIEHAKKIDLQNVSFLGKQMKDDLIAAFEKNDALILFSNFETQGCVILEAQACGMPVIGSNIGGIPELINTDLGLLVTPGNEQELAEAIKNIAKNINSYDFKTIRSHAIANYSYEHIAEKLLSFYERGLALKAKSPL